MNEQLLLRGAEGGLLNERYRSAAEGLANEEADRRRGIFGLGIAAESPVKTLCVGMVPDLQRIARPPGEAHLYEIKNVNIINFGL